jgi:hypothetical protein
MDASNRKAVLLCMRLDEMSVVHPDQITEVCSKCNEPVGIYPSGQQIILQYGRHNVELICNRCHDGNFTRMSLAPGTGVERAQSVRRKTD